jgi:excisionase family DNA binding protein
MLLDINEDRAYTVQDAAKFLGVTEEAVLSLIHRGELPASNINTKPNAQRPRWRILSSDLGRFLMKTRHQVPTAQPKRRSKAAVKDYFQ